MLFLDFAVTLVMELGNLSDDKNFLTILNLLLIGVFVGRIKPRQGRLGGIMPGLFIYMLYISSLSMV